MVLGKLLFFACSLCDSQRRLYILMKLKIKCLEGEEVILEEEGESVY